jgi:hypothetical protein
MQILVVDDETDVKFLFEQHFRRQNQEHGNGIYICVPGRTGIDHFFIH